MDYLTLRHFLFRLDPEHAHTLTLSALKWLTSLGAIRPPQQEGNPKTLMGLHFPHPVGLAAGLDKNGDYIDALSQLGFAFLELGTVTPKPQVGNPKPRLFRLIPEQALINRMGFNNKGVDHLVKKLQQRQYQGIIGVNIGKNATTPLSDALDDYLYCMKKVYPYASYITVNISSPNTAGLRDLQGADYLKHLLEGLKIQQSRLADQYGRYAPLVLKVAPDLTELDIHQMAEEILASKIDGVIATNTTIDRKLIKDSTYAGEQGGLSGAPLFEKANQTLKILKDTLKGGHVPIIASGGVMSAEHAAAKMAAGADLVQLYTGLIYKGPKLIRECVCALSAKRGQSCLP